MDDDRKREFGRQYERTYQAQQARGFEQLRQQVWRQEDGAANISRPEVLRRASYNLARYESRYGDVPSSSSSSSSSRSSVSPSSEWSSSSSSRSSTSPSSNWSSSSSSSRSPSSDPSSGYPSSSSSSCYRNSSSSSMCSSYSCYPSSWKRY